MRDRDLVIFPEIRVAVRTESEAAGDRSSIVTPEADFGVIIVPRALSAIGGKTGPVGIRIGSEHVVEVPVAPDAGRVLLIVAGGAGFQIPNGFEAVSPQGPIDSGVIRRHDLFPVVAVVAEPLIRVADRAIFFLSLGIEGMDEPVVQRVGCLHQVIPFVALEAGVVVVVTAPTSSVVLRHRILVRVFPARWVCPAPKTRDVRVTQ
jgi:hypothetical protein